MRDEFLKSLQAKYRRGWYRKGKSYRFLYALNYAGFLIYQTKSNALKNSKSVVGLNPEMDDWFDKADYLGLENPFE